MVERRDGAGNTGRYPALSDPELLDRASQGSIPMPPPKDPEERERWIVGWLQVAYRNGAEAREALLEIREQLGFSPDPARGIAEGKGLMGQLSKIIAQGEKRQTEDAALEREQKARSETRRSMFAGVSIALGIFGAALGILKAASELFRH